MTRAEWITHRAIVERTFHRRRIVLAVLFLAAFASLVSALVTSDATMWAVQIFADGLILAYLALMVHFRNSAAATEMSLR